MDSGSRPTCFRNRTEALARASTGARGFLETPALILDASHLAAEEPWLPDGTLVGPYQVIGLLARGGTGDVYRATDTRLDRDVALKVLAPNRSGDRQRVERFNARGARHGFAGPPQHRAGV